MSAPTLVAFPDNTTLVALLAPQLEARVVSLGVHEFPDCETGIRLCAEPDGDLAFVCTLDRPNAKFLPLIFAARTARELGSRRVGLVAPYLAYMRQDTRFRAGEAVSARLFAEELSRAFDWIVTVDPHLHRIADLADVFSIPCETVHAAPVVADWINHNIEAPLIVGPDGESSQWVADVARRCNAPFVTFAKSRLADRRVVLSGTAPPKSDRVPVILDDIVSSGHTMAEAVRLTTNTFGVRPWVVGIHAVFAPGAEQALAAANPVGVVTCNTIDHPSNRIDVSVPLADAVGRVCTTST